MLHSFTKTARVVIARTSRPFSLITYKDVRKRSLTIRETLFDRYMPPWKPVNTNIHFANNRRLSDEEIELFSQWVEAGTPEGDPEKKPKVPEYPSGWYLGEPDLVVTMQGKFEVPAEGRDIYRSFIFPLQLPEDKWVKAVELRPKARSAVHHALFFIDPTGTARKRDGRDGKAGCPGWASARISTCGRAGPSPRPPSTDPMVLAGTSRARPRPGFPEISPCFCPKDRTW